jgi:hypothetical protein
VPLPAIQIGACRIGRTPDDANTNRKTEQNDGDKPIRDQRNSDETKAEDASTVQQVTVTGFKDWRVYAPERFKTPEEALDRLLQVMTSSAWTVLRQTGELTSDVSAMAGGEYHDGEPKYWSVSKNSESRGGKEATHGNPLIDAMTIYIVHSHATSGAWDMLPSVGDGGDYFHLATSNFPRGGPMRFRQLVGVLLAPDDKVWYYGSTRVDGNYFDFLHQYSPKETDFLWQRERL